MPSGSQIFNGYEFEFARLGVGFGVALEFLGSHNVPELGGASKAPTTHRWRVSAGLAVVASDSARRIAFELESAANLDARLPLRSLTA